MWCQWSLEVTAPQDATSQRNLELNVGPGVSSQHDWNSVWHFKVTNSDRNTRPFDPVQQDQSFYFFLLRWCKNKWCWRTTATWRDSNLFGSIYAYIYRVNPKLPTCNCKEDKEIKTTRSYCTGSSFKEIEEKPQWYWCSYLEPYNLQPWPRRQSATMRILWLRPYKVIPGTKRCGLLKGMDMYDDVI